MSNWHDAMRLTLLRCLGAHNRDVRRLLISWCEAAHAMYLLHELNFNFKVRFGYKCDASFHQICKRRKLLDEYLKHHDFDKYYDGQKSEYYLFK